MKELFDNISNEAATKYSFSESKWWNGHAYLPLKNHIWRISFPNAVVLVQYENRQNEFSKPAFGDSGTYGDRHIFKITCNVNDAKTFPSFEVSARKLMSRIFKKNVAQPYIVDCDNHELKSMLGSNESLKSIYQIVEESPEFAPLIKGERTNEKYLITIDFNVQQINEMALHAIIQFCKDFADFIKT